MALRYVAEYLNSGEAIQIGMSETTRYDIAADPQYEDMFLKIGPGGLTTLHRFPDQDVHWIDVDLTDIELTTTSVGILSVTPDLDLLPSDSGYQISGVLDNNSNQEQTVTITVHDGTSSVTQDIILAKEEMGKVFAYTGLVTNTIVANTTITVAFENSSNNNVNLRGDIVATKIKVTKAQAAPVTTLGITQDVTVGHGSNQKTLHIVDGLITSVS